MVILDNPLRDRQAKAAANPVRSGLSCRALVVRARPIYLIEAVEEMRQVLWSDAGTVIRDLDGNRCLSRERGSNLHLASDALTMFEGVLDDGGEQLAPIVPIALYAHLRERCDGDRRAILLCERRQALDGIEDAITQIKRVQRHRCLPAICPR